MPQILVPSSGPECWKALLAKPDKHWKSEFSARTLAHCWEAGKGFPPEVKAILSTTPALGNVEPLLILPEWKVPLPGGVRPSQNDVWVLAKNDEGLVSIAIEGKVRETFGPTVGEWKAEPSPGKEIRLPYLTKVLGLQGAIPETIRYQLLHRTASAVIEAQRFGAHHAVMLVHSFSPANLGFDDFSAFAALFPMKCEVGRLASTHAEAGLPLHIGWVHGDEQFLSA